MKASKLVWMFTAFVALLFTGRTSNSQTVVALDRASPFHVSLKLDDSSIADHSMTPIVYREPISGTVLYVESDRRHVSAISQEGKVLWFRDPFADLGYHPVWDRNPGIVKIGATADGKHVVLSYGRSLTGTVDLATGNRDSSWTQD